MFNYKNKINKIKYIREIRENKYMLEFFLYKKVLVIFILSSLFFVIFCFFIIYRDPLLRVKFISVGQGDSAIITYNNKNILIDTGPNYIASYNVPYNINNLILTHNDIDHTGGLISLNNNKNIEKVYVNNTNTYDFVKKIVSKDSLEEEIEVIDLTKNNRPETDDSDNSSGIVNIISKGAYNFIFLADIDENTEFLLKSNQSFDKVLKNKKNILKIAHHGSKTSSSEDVLKKVKPYICVISVGKDNKFKHPDTDVLNRLYKYCGSIYRTDLDKEINISTDGEYISIDY